LTAVAVWVQLLPVASALAETLQATTLDALAQWYASTGCIFEFYDSANQVG
jgi:hypothetical protein